MVKKEVRSTNQAHHSEKIEEKIIYNLVELQKVHVDLAEKFNKLSEQIASLLRLFESAALAFAKQTNLPNIEKDNEFLDKINKLLDQNKTIAKGLMLMEEKLRERIYGPQYQQRQQNQPPPYPSRQLPRL